MEKNHLGSQAVYVHLISLHWIESFFSHHKLKVQSLKFVVNADKGSTLHMFRGVLVCFSLTKVSIDVLQYVCGKI